MRQISHAFGWPARGLVLYTTPWDGQVNREIPELLSWPLRWPLRSLLHIPGPCFPFFLKADTLK